MERANQPGAATPNGRSGRGVVITIRASTGPVISLAVLLLVGLLASGADAQESAGQRERVCVIDFQVNDELRQDVPDLSKRLTSVVSTALSVSFDLVPRDELIRALKETKGETNDLSDSPDEAAALGRRLKVGKLVVGRASRSKAREADKRISLDLRVMDVATSAFGDAVRADADADAGDIDAVIGRLLVRLGLLAVSPEDREAPASVGLLKDHSRWDAAAAAERLEAAQHIGQRNEGVTFVRMERFEAGGQNHEVGVFTHESTGLEFALLPVGRYLRGSPPEEKHRGFYEERQEVILTKPFLIARTECTQRAWDRVGGEDERRWKGEELPIEGVSWEDVSAWCHKAGLRLPTEAEWEYACRAGTTTPFNLGENVTTREANFDGRHPYLGRQTRPRHKTIPVTRLPHNAFGLHNMHGNVSEWCLDDFRAPKRTQGSVTDPVRAPGNRRRDMVVRGGSWSAWAPTLRSARASHFPAWGREDIIGFRPALSVVIE